MLPDAASPDIVLTGPALHAAKRALRVQMIGARDAIDPALRASASRTIAARLQELPSFARARTVLLTLPFRSEWDTRPLALAALAEGKTLVAPRINGTARMLELHAITDIEHHVAPGYRGIPEPLSTLPRIDAAAVDWVLVPGVAFTAEGRRLGYGGGYYDRLMPSLTLGTTLVAGTFDAQIVAQIPSAAHDLRVDMVVTESRILPAPAER
jgi:5-formyltetrahydrofolate cyclo-ligase